MSVSWSEGDELDALNSSESSWIPDNEESTSDHVTSEQDASDEDQAVAGGSSENNDEHDQQEDESENGLEEHGAGDKRKHEEDSDQEDGKGEKRKSKRRKRYENVTKDQRIECECPICGAIYFSRKQWRQHLRVKHYTQAGPEQVQVSAGEFINATHSLKCFQFACPCLKPSYWRGSDTLRPNYWLIGILDNLVRNR